MNNYTQSVFRISNDTVEPVDLQFLKDHTRIEFAEDDHLLQSYIKSSRIWFENLTQTTVIPSIWNLYLDRFPSVIRLPNPPTQEVLSIVYIDTNGDEQELDGADYQVDTFAQPGRITPAPNTCFPATQCSRLNAVTVSFSAGYQDASSVPENIKHWICLATAYKNDQREPTDRVPGYLYDLAIQSAVGGI